MASYVKPNAMTSNEILKADVLDIVFDNRNKQYGAYPLRKYYNNRLVVALGGMLGFVSVIVLVALLNPSLQQTISNAIDQADTVIVSVLPPPAIEPPPALHPVRSTVRQINHDRFEIVDEPTDVPEQTGIRDAVVSNNTVVSEDPRGHQANAPEATPPALVPAIEPAVPSPVTNSAAAFPGGQQAWMAFLNRYLRTPDELEAGHKKTVLVRFSVSEDGSITQFEIVQSGGAVFDNEVIRVLKKMPRWKPAVQNGHAVSVMFTQPVTFMAIEE